MTKNKTQPVTHTPKPWKAINLNWGMQILPPPDYGRIRVIAAIGDDEKGGPHRTAEVRANALVMAAAPELLEIAKTINSKIDQKLLDYVGPQASLHVMLKFEEIEALRAAIAKAKGEVPNA